MNSEISFCDFKSIPLSCNLLYNTILIFYESYFITKTESLMTPGNTRPSNGAVINSSSPSSFFQMKNIFDVPTSVTLGNILIYSILKNDMLQISSQPKNLVISIKFCISRVSNSWTIISNC